MASPPRRAGLSVNNFSAHSHNTYREQQLGSKLER